MIELFTAARFSHTQLAYMYVSLVAISRVYVYPDYYNLHIGDGKSTSVDEAGASVAVEEEKDKLLTKKPAMLPLAEDMTVMQIDCGTFHTGE